MLPPALLAVADRLVNALMSLVDAIAPVALDASTPTLASHAAETLFFRLATLVATLIRITNCGIRARAEPAAERDPPDPEPGLPRSPPTPTQPLPRHRGWLLEALPDTAPAVAADLAALLADPAFADLLAAAPTVERALKPLLRSLGLTLPAPSPGPDPAAPPSLPPHPAHPRLRPPAGRAAPLPRTGPLGQALTHAHIVTMS